MRFKNKYKLYNSKKYNLSLDIPWRILKFKRTKWNRLISLIKRQRRSFPLINLKSKTKSKYQKKKIIKQIKQSIYYVNKNNYSVSKKELFVKYFQFIGHIRLISFSSKFYDLNKKKFFVESIREYVRRSKVYQNTAYYPLGNINIYIPPKKIRISQLYLEQNRFYKNMHVSKKIKIYVSTKIKVEKNQNVNPKVYVIKKKQELKTKFLSLPKDFYFFQSILKLKNILKKYKNKKKLKIQESFLPYTSFRNLKIRCSIKNWTRNNLYYKSSLLLQKYYYLLYDSNIAYKTLKKFVFAKKKQKGITEIFQTIFGLEFRVDVLLWKLRFFKSTFEARTFINTKLIQVNSKSIKGNHILKKGDIITFHDNLYLAENLARLKKNFLLQNFFEVNFYSNTIIILQSPDEIDLATSMFQLRKYFDIFKFRYSFK